MKMASVLGSWLRRQLDNRWQWVALLGLLAFFNTAASDNNQICYLFRITPDFVLMDVREFERELKVFDTRGTLAISSVCTPANCATITPNIAAKTISVVADPAGQGITGKCTITAIDTLSDGSKRYASATVEVAKLPIHVYIERSGTRSDDFGTLEAMSPGESRSIAVSGGVKPFVSVKNVFPSILELTLTNVSGGNFTVKALKPGIGAVRITDGGMPAEKVTLTFLVQ
jgi:hypothetical protein